MAPDVIVDLPKARLRMQVIISGSVRGCESKPKAQKRAAQPQQLPVKLFRMRVFGEQKYAVGGKMGVESVQKPELCHMCRGESDLKLPAVARLRAVTLALLSSRYLHEPLSKSELSAGLALALGMEE